MEKDLVAFSGDCALERVSTKGAKGNSRGSAAYI
jgi:hypothetical protein